MLGVCDGITDDVLKENFEYASGLLVDQSRDTLDTTTTSETANSGLGDSLDVITQHLAMTLSASLSESLSSFAASRHDVFAVDDRKYAHTWAVIGLCRLARTRRSNLFLFQHGGREQN